MNTQKQPKQEKYNAMIVALLVNVVTFVLLVYPRVDFSPKTILEWLTNALAVAQIVLLLVLTAAIQKNKKGNNK